MSNEMKLSLILIFVQGFGMGGRVFIGFVWMSENLCAIDVPWATSIMFLLDGLCITVATLWFSLVSKEWSVLYAIPLCIQFVVIICFLYQTETPKYHFGKGNYDAAREILTHIGHVNGTLEKNEEFSK